MKRVCSYCKKVYGEKEPLNDNRETHGACMFCFKIEMSRIKKMQKERGKNYGTRD